MNREIKFRAWDIEQKTMRLIAGFTQYRQITEIIYGISGFKKCATDMVILMQYTGLKDRNGVEIYEGDVVQHSAWDYPFTVIFYQYRARFVCEMKSGLTHYITNEEMEVIGNIYENPNLINP